MPLSGLAQVELQLIMHCCDLHSLLALARCCRFTLAAASSSFAWCSLPPLPLTFPHRSGSSLGALLSSSILRHCAVSLAWTHRVALNVQPPCDERELAELSIHHIRCLDAQQRKLGSQALVALLSHPALAELEELTLGEQAQVDRDDVARLMDAPAPLRLCRLQLDLRRSGALLAWLPHLPRLSHLHLTALHADLPSLTWSSCPSLRSFTLCAMNSGALFALLSSPLPQVVQLTLVQCTYSQPLWGMALQRFPHLRQLTLQSCYHLQGWMEALTCTVAVSTRGEGACTQAVASAPASLPQLHSLCIHLADGFAYQHHSRWPTQLQVTALLAARPSLALTLQLSPVAALVAAGVAGARSSDLPRRWRKVRAHCDEIQQSYPDQVILKCD